MKAHKMGKAVRFGKNPKDRAKFSNLGKESALWEVVTVWKRVVFQ